MSKEWLAVPGRSRKAGRWGLQKCLTVTWAAHTGVDTVCSHTESSVAEDPWSLWTETEGAHNWVMYSQGTSRPVAEAVVVLAERSAPAKAVYPAVHTLSEAVLAGCTIEKRTDSLRYGRVYLLVQAGAP